MFVRKLSSTVVLAVCCHLIFTGLSSSALAQGNEGVVRTFGFVASLSADGEAFFLGEESLGVIVAPPDRSTRGDMEFISDPTVDWRVDGTSWIYQDAMHVTTGAPDHTPGAFAWLLTPDTPEPPPVGSFTFTGPGSPRIVDQQIFYRGLCDSGDCGGYRNNGKFYVDDLYPTNIFVVVTAVFSK